MGIIVTHSNQTVRPLTFPINPSEIAPQAVEYGIPVMTTAYLWYCKFPVCTFITQHLTDILTQKHPSMHSHFLTSVEIEMANYSIADVSSLGKVFSCKVVLS